jgi:competence protein ComEA
MSFYRLAMAAITAMSITTIGFAAKEVPPTTKATQATLQATKATREAKVNINSATAKDLMKVKGLTRTKANSLVSYRKSHGDFKSLDDLKEVKGFKRINEKNLKKIQEQLAV